MIKAQRVGYLWVEYTRDARVLTFLADHGYM